MCDEIKNEDQTAETPDKEAGFTLVEVMVTMTIIVLVLGFMAFNLFPLITDSKMKRAKGDIKILGQAVQMYNLQLNQFPDEADGLEALYKRPSGIDEAKYPKGGFIETRPVDPWDNPYQYRYPGDYGVFDIFSYCADGEPGGEGENADIVSWETEDR